MSYDPRFSREAMNRQASYARWMRECDRAHHAYNGTSPRPDEKLPPKEEEG